MPGELQVPLHAFKGNAPYIKGISTHIIRSLFTGLVLGKCSILAHSARALFALQLSHAGKRAREGANKDRALAFPLKTVTCLAFMLG